MIRLLVVDDDTTVGDAMVELLALYGLDASQVAGGCEALEAVQRAGFDMIVLDVHMRGMGGLTTYRKLREMGVTVPVIALTGLPSSPEAQRLRKEYGVRVFNKPPNIDDLVACIRRTHGDG